ncbi:hypothetical protein K443DRAFT_124551 [Laccaria amethystina LaAM-08-1]|uniref:Uncharacterized protein n=1 Tax=Laccaria amethystina LaAM-08-1 TaxID=1095629 RepID=A0A0C9XIV7_9AGAR|nr:hypothetical protein K443DRAFT_124551 [Laccaria amethystina LaAM-08-1]
MAADDQDYQSSEKSYLIAWTKRRSLRVFRKTKISHQNTPRGDSPDDKTEPTLVPPKAKRPGPPSSKAGDSRKTKWANSGDVSPWLDDVTLGELDTDIMAGKSSVDSNLGGTSPTERDGGDSFELRAGTIGIQRLCAPSSRLE